MNAWRAWSTRKKVIVVGAVVVLAAIVSSSGSRAPATGSNTPQPTRAATEPAPTSENNPAPTTPTPEATAVSFAPIVLSGSGSKVAQFTKPEGVAAIAVIASLGTAHFAIWSLAANGEKNDLLVNGTGGYSGTRLFDTDTHSVAFEVTATGEWSMVIEPVGSARTWSGSGPLTGGGDDVVLLTPPTSGLTVATITHTGRAHFAVIGYSTSGFTDLMVNTGGNYSGETTVDEGTYLIEISADGEWEITRS